MRRASVAICEHGQCSLQSGTLRPVELTGNQSTYIYNKNSTAHYQSHVWLLHLIYALVDNDKQTNSSAPNNMPILINDRFFCFSLSSSFCNRELHDGTSIKENGIMDGSKIILLPNVETGLLVSIVILRFLFKLCFVFLWELFFSYLCFSRRFSVVFSCLSCFFGAFQVFWRLFCRFFRGSPHKYA